MIPRDLEERKVIVFAVATAIYCASINNPSARVMMPHEAVEKADALIEAVERKYGDTRATSGK
jgi:hypothetical protein